MEATLNACIRQSDLVTAEHVMQEAKVSRGTFYAHFKSAEDAIAHVAREVRMLRDILQDVESPIEHLAVGGLVIFTHAAVDPGWAFVLSRSDHFDWESIAVSWLQSQVKAAITAVGVPRPDVAVAVMLDLCTGLVIQSAKRLMGSRLVPWDYILEASSVVLESMGIARKDAHAAVTWAKDYLDAMAPRQIDWWPVDAPLAN
jgi:AcrR family transcriptional regulator